MPWNATLSNLRAILVALYPSEGDIRRVADTAGVPTSFIRIEASPVNAWHSVLSEADKRGLVPSLLAVAQEEYPDNHELQGTEFDCYREAGGPVIGRDIVWRGPGVTEDLERIIGAESTLVPVSFLQLGIIRQRSVVRIDRGDGYGSGFLTAGRLIVTNNHVIPSADVARRCRVEFNFQLAVDGNPELVDEYSLSPDDGFATSKDDDWTVVRVAGNPSEIWGEIPIQGLPVAVGDRVNIVQHPSGGLKQMSFFHNRVVFADDRVVQYLTDTMKGSSGSPVFDRWWQVVALHHSSVSEREQGSMRVIFKNEGIRIGLVADGIASLAHG